MNGIVRRWLFLLILGALSIINMFLSFLLLNRTTEIFQQVLAFLILTTTLLAFIVLTMSRNIIQESLDTTGLRGWLIICLIITSLFIVTGHISVSLFFFQPIIVDFLYFFTIILNALTGIFVLNAVIDVRLKRWSVNLQNKQLENYLENKARIKDRSSFPIEFESITRKLVGPSAQTIPCPHCLSAIDFNEKIEWLGPTSMICNQCGKIVDIVDLLDGI